ncbi:DUF3822 family protein [Leptobacterium sp. I13]|uniref:DUF3822 family protein n=1 Tax=Leptobacterium meishanense TaxID=3128904 RepID=UPI0030EE1F8B
MTLEKISNISNPKEKELSIQVSLSGLSFCVLNPIKKSTEELQYYRFRNIDNPNKLLNEIIPLFDNAPDFKSLKKIKVLHSNDLSSVVPKNLFDENKLSDYLKYNIKILKNDFIAYDTIANGEIINVYVPYVNVNNFLLDQLGPFEYQHSSSILIDTLIKNTLLDEKPIMYIHVEQTHFEVIVIQNKKLVFYNTFHYQTKEDFIYYILFTAEQLKLDPEEFHLRFLGVIAEHDANYQMAYKYIRHITIENDAFHNYSENSSPNNLFSDFILQNAF